MSGARSYHAGLAAEEAVARHYAQRGHAVLARRWRGKGGELDLVVENGAGVIFIEVKTSSDFTAAVAHLGPRQIARIFDAAAEFLGRMPDGQATETRFDVALVDGKGEVEILEAALGP